MRREMTGRVFPFSADFLSPTTLVVIQATLDALKSMFADSPRLTIFNRESQSAKTAWFPVTLAGQGNED